LDIRRKSYEKTNTIPLCVNFPVKHQVTVTAAPYFGELLTKGAFCGCDVDES
jgi:C4-type Zn-finger protein